MISSPPIDRATTHGHAAFLYKTPEERMRLLAGYFIEGLAAHELCVLVTSLTDKEVIKSFKEVGFDPHKSIKQGSLRVFEMEATYLSDGHFVADYMLHNVSSFIKDAKRQGFSGLRTAGEMSWIFNRPDDIAEAMKYESDVNSLLGDDVDFMGLCLYPVQETYSDMIKDVMDTHPSLIYDGVLQINPKASDILAYSTA